MNCETKVKEILAELSGEETIVNDATLQSDLALDSLSMVAMIIELEEAFNIRLEESDMNPYDLTTVQSVIDMVSRYAGEENE